MTSWLSLSLCLLVMDTQSSLDVPYGPSPPHKLDLHYAEHAAGRPLVVFVHGGAWRAEDKAHHSQLAARLALASGCAVAVPNYRLTPSEPTPETALRHPAHAEDVLAALEFLHQWPDPPVRFDRSALYLVGHSCGAHILTAIFLDSSAVSPSLTPSPSLLAGVKGVAVSEGIYDIDRLLVSFPDYKGWFIVNAFGDRASYAEYSTTNYGVRENSKVSWLIIHSHGDSLVDIVQSQAIYDHLHTLHPATETAAVQRDWDTLKLEHNEMLKTEEYSTLVGRYFKDLMAT